MTYLATSLEWKPSALKASTYLYVVGAADPVVTKSKLAERASKELEAKEVMVVSGATVTVVEC